MNAVLTAPTAAEEIAPRAASADDAAPPLAGSMVHLAEIVQRHTKLKLRRFEMLPLRGPGAVYADGHGRQPGDATTPAGLSDLISSIEVIGLLEPVLAEEIPNEEGPPTLRLVTGARRLRAMRWGAVHRPDNPHFSAMPAVVCPGPLSEEERHMWRFVENFAREQLKPGEQAAALMYHRCAILLGKLLKAGRLVPSHVYGIPDSVERFQALERIRGNDNSCAAPWSEVLGRLGLQLDERKATELVRAFRELPRELTLEMDEHAVRLHTRIRFAELRRGREQAASDIWAALKGSNRLHLLPGAVAIGLAEPGLGPDEIVAGAEQRRDAANAARSAKLSRVPPPPAEGSADEDLPAPATGQAADGDNPAPDPAPTAVTAVGGPADRDDAERVPATPPAPGSAASAPGAEAPAADPDTVRAAVEGLRGLLAELRAGRTVPRYDRGSLLLAFREVTRHLESSPGDSIPDTPTPSTPVHEMAGAA